MLQALQQSQLMVLKAAYQLLDKSYTETGNIAADITRLHAALPALVQAHQKKVSKVFIFSAYKPLPVSPSEQNKFTFFSLAAMIGDLSLLTEISEKANVSSRDGADAAFYAALFNQGSVIAFLAQKNYQLFQSYTALSLTPLHVASVLGHADTVQAILATSELFLLNCLTTSTQQTAYELTVAHAQPACRHLFETHPEFAWELKEKALNTNQVSELVRLLSLDQTGDPLVIQRAFGATSLLAKRLKKQAKMINISPYATPYSNCLIRIPMRLSSTPFSLPWLPFAPMKMAHPPR